MAVGAGTATVRVRPSLEAGGLRNLEGSLVSRLGGIGKTAGAKLSNVFAATIGGIAKGGGIAGALFGGSALKLGFDRLTTIQDATASLTITLGSAAKAAGLMKNVLDVVKGTPFSLDQFAGAARNLAAFNVPLQKIPTYLRAIGEAGAASGSGAQGVQQLVDVFGKVSAQGQLALDDVWSISNSGVNALAILANGFGTTTTSMKKMISKGAVPADKALDILSKGIISGSDGAAGHVNGLGGSMQALGKTTSGAISNVKAAFARFGATLLQPIFARMPGIVDAVSHGLDRVGAAVGPALSKFGTQAKGSISAFVEAFKAGGDDITSSGFNGKVEAVALGIRKAWDGLGNIFRGGTGSKIMDVLARVVETFKSAFAAIKAIVTVAVHFIEDLWDRFGSHLLKHLQTAWNAILQVVRGALQILQGVFQLIADLLTGKWSKLWSDLQRILSGAWNIILGVIKTAVNLISTIIGLAMALVSSLWSRLWDGISRALSAAWGVITRTVSSGADAVVRFIVAIPGRLGDIGSRIWHTITAGASNAALWVKSKIDQIVGFFTGMGARIGNAGGSLFSGLYNAVQSFINWVISQLNRLPGVHIGTSKVGNFFLGSVSSGYTVGGRHNPPAAAAGAYVTARMGGTLVRIGEGGQDEAVLPLSRLQPMLNQAMRAVASGTAERVTKIYLDSKEIATVLSTRQAAYA